jgi:AcrR family transcriptional regulator
VARRDDLAVAATDYVLENGLVGLSLRPLADALGTSDRMLLYHFGSKDDLVATILRTSNDRSVAHIKRLAPPPDARHAVLELWSAVSSAPIASCCRLYVEASALGLLGREPYAVVVRELNEEWMTALADYLGLASPTAELARRIAGLVDATFMGLFLDMPLDDLAARGRAVADLAEAAVLIAGTG